MNIKHILSEMQKKILKQLLENPNALPAGERDKLIKELVSNIGNLDR
jgi:hypothetical protein